MKVEIIAREVVKPSSPTPKSLKNFKLSLIDQLTPPVYGSMLVFYISRDQTTHCVSNSNTSRQLKKSLSDTLTLYYPLAGRLKDNIMIDSSDYGALYVEARVDGSMSRFLEKPNGDELEQLIAIDLGSTEAITGGFFSLVQVSFFDCGGVAIGFSTCHKLSDATTVGMFMRCWAANTKCPDKTETVMLPIYNAAALFPPGKLPPSVPLFELKKDEVPKTRLVFDTSKIAALMVAAASPSVDRPSRVEAVTALIWKCALKAARLNSGSSRQSVLIQAVNIRPRMSPQLPMNSVGNLIWSYTAQKDESELDLQGLVGELREKIQVFDTKYMKMLQRKDAFEAALTEYGNKVASLKVRDDIEFYVCSSLCNSSLYDMNFGWGRPVWVTIPNASTKTMTLLDTRKGDGSVEAWVVLSEEDMYLFERDPELLAYASLNPSVLDTKSRWIKSSI